MNKIHEKTIAWVCEKTGRYRRYLKIHRNIFLTIQSIFAFFYAGNVEFAEKLSILYSVAVFVPVTMYYWYLASSPYLRGLAEVLPRPVLMTLSGFLLVFQTSAIVLGSKSTKFKVSEIDRYFWLRVRRVGLLVASGFWMAMGVCLSPQMITIGSILFIGGGFFCSAGSVNLQQAIIDAKESLKVADIAEVAIAEGTNA